jgi:Spy/CpxP family protein refolding chaperone
VHRKWIIVALAFLAVINISALTTLGYRRYCLNRDCINLTKASDPGINTNPLTLTDDQSERIKSLRQSFCSIAAQSGKDLQESRAVLIDSLEIFMEDSARIEYIIETINQKQCDFQRKCVQHLMQEIEILQPDQRKVFLDLLKQRLLQEIPCDPMISMSPYSDLCGDKCNPTN